MREVLTDIALYAGVAMITIGACLRYGPAGLILGGALVITGALLYARGA
ncbi:MAG TPA: hypothetical protein VJ738_01895 [Steroidobacteraceae bacterium]|nr:hypothetical protein [Steroidobacteraceae bacterium]